MVNFFLKYSFILFPFSEMRSFISLLCFDLLTNQYNVTSISGVAIFRSERKSSLAHQMAEKQKKRTENIKARAEAKKAPKGKSIKKKVKIL